MSILDEIEIQCKAERLIMVTPSYPRPHGAAMLEPRQIYITPSIDEFLKSDNELADLASADLTEFIFGERWEASLYSDHEFYCRMSRLDEAREEVWELRIWDVEPQVRFYGRFALRNIFIALDGPLFKRRFFQRRINHEAIKQTCISAWQSLFTYEPLSRGGDIDAYLSNVEPS